MLTQPAQWISILPYLRLCEEVMRSGRPLDQSIPPHSSVGLPGTVARELVLGQRIGAGRECLTDRHQGRIHAGLVQGVASRQEWRDGRPIARVGARWPSAWYVSVADADREV